ncbi:MAG TPA: SIS domain-containing protein [Verrucomicrobiae bacterium]|jgi:D-sedoheptulose 7-phosphate isomerase|nr:SIS domain-containing protein [Verrucomicrobiae bacterium]
METATATPTENFREKILRKCGESIEMKEKFFSKYAEEIEAMARDMAASFQAGKKLLVMGNGGSLCDALHFSVEFTHPIIEKRRAFPVIPLMTDICTMTAISNDLDYSRVFVNQLQLLGQPGDMALVVSTSGKSPNLVYALEAARDKKMMTIAWLGKDGGRLAEMADYSFVVPSYSIHRIQEVHATLVHVAWDLIHIALGEDDVI